MAEITTTRKQGIGLPVDGVEFWPAESNNYTEAGNAAGIPVPQQATKMAVTASGEPTSAINIRTQEPGVAGLIAPSGEAVYQGATFISQLDPDADGSGWHGWDPAISMSSITTVDYSNTATADSTGRMTVATTPTGHVICAVENLFAGAYRTDVFVLDPATQTWGNRILVAEYDAATVNRNPCVVALPSGRVHLYEVIDRFIRLWYSDDNGATWSFGGDKISSRATAADVTSMVGAFSNGQVLLLCEMTTNFSEQFASNDMGVTLQHVDTVQAIEPAVSATRDGFVVASNLFDGGAYTLASQSLQSAYFSIADVANSAPAGFTTVDYLEIVSDPCGINWLYVGDNGSIFPFISYDNASSWVQPVDNQGCFRQMSAADHLKDYAATWQRGRVVMVGKANAPTTTAYRDIRALTLGGWSNRSVCSYSQSPADSQAGGWDRTYAPFDVPTASGWALVSATGSDAIGASTGLLSVTTSGGARTYTQSGVSFANGVDMGARWRCRPGNGMIATLQSDTISLETRAGGGVWQLRDVVSTAVLANGTYDNALTDSVEFWVELDVSANYCIVWLREIYNTGANQRGDDERRRWIEMHRGTLTATTGLTPGITWGNAASFTTTTWHSVQVSDRGLDGFHLSATFGQGESELRGRHMTGKPYALGGVYVAPLSGPAWRGEQWSIAKDPLYGVNNVLIDSPRIPYRSTGIDNGASLAFKWSDTGPANTESIMLAIVLRSCNLHDIDIEYYDSTGWVSAGTFTPGVQGFAASQVGGVVSPSANASPVFLQADEYMDGTIYGYASGAAKSTYEAARITHHTEGSLSNLKPVVAKINTDVPIVNTADITPKDYVILLEVENLCGGVRLSVPSTTVMPDPAESYIEIGHVGLYWVYPFGNEYAWGRSVETQAQVEAVRTRDGQVKHRVVSPPRRRITLNWDPFDQAMVEPELADPDYTSFDQTNDGQTAARSGTALVLESMVRRLDGPTKTVLYLPKVPLVEAGIGHAMLYRRREFYVGRIQEAISATYVLGDELTDEVVQPGSMVIEEEV